MQLSHIQFVDGVNTPFQKCLENIRSAVGRGLPWMRSEAPHDKAAAIVAGGPSLADTWQMIGNQIPFTVNGTHDYLIERGVIPAYHVMLDARPDNAVFVQEPSPLVTYMVASQCDPVVFDALEGFDTVLWHAAAGTAEPIIDAIGGWGDDPTRAEAVIMNGNTVGLRAACIAWNLGFRELHLYGFDSSYRDTHHAYPQPLNDDGQVVEVIVAGRTFRTSPTFAKQAHLAQEILGLLTLKGANVILHGDGLLQTIIRQMNVPLAEREANKYRQMWEVENYRRWSLGADLVERAVDVMGLDQSSTVIDFGCGSGRAVKKFQRRYIQATGVDFAENAFEGEFPHVVACLWDMPPMRASHGFCVDVMEHIPPEKVDAVLEGISARVDDCFFQICTVDDHLGSLIGEKLHLTVQEPDWWVSKIGEFFPVVDEVSRGHKSVIVRGRHEQG